MATAKKTTEKKSATKKAEPKKTAVKKTAAKPVAKKAETKKPTRKKKAAKTEFEENTDYICNRMGDNLKKGRSFGASFLDAIFGWCEKEESKYFH